MSNSTRLASIFVALSLLAAPAVASAAPDPAPVVVTSDVRPVATTPSDASSYATREKQAKNLDKFEGGDEVVIVGSTGALIVVLIVLILVL